MGIWRRKQSGSSGESNTLSGTVTPEGSEGQDLAKTPSRLMRTLAGGFRSSKPKKSNESNYAHLERPFTKQNLEHQKILDAFTFNFGKRKLSQGGRSSFSGVSPGASRHASTDSSHIGPGHLVQHGGRRDTHAPFGSSLIAEPSPQEVPGEESDKDTNQGPTGVFPKTARH